MSGRGLKVVDLGVMRYADAYDVQKRIALRVQTGAPHHLLFVEHPPVLTLGANFHAENLLLPVEAYAERGIEVEQTDRGGDVTYHGPGQIVVYPVFDVAELGKDLHRWLRNLEEVMIRCLSEFSIIGQRLAVNSGVWVEDRKICAIGIKMRRWISIHGLALNVQTDLSPFEWIVPCGVKGHGVTSMHLETSVPHELSTVKHKLIQHFESVFGLESETRDDKESLAE